MPDPGVHTAICIAIEMAINAALRYDPGTRFALAKLTGKVLAVDLSPPGMTLYVAPDEEFIDVFSQYEGEVTTRVKGSPLALVSLVRSKQLNLADSGVEVFGNTGFLIELTLILSQLDIDWEEALNDVLGDVLGHPAAQGIRSVLGWAKDRKNSFSRLLGEYLTEELRGTPSRNELEGFYKEVDDLHLATDRLAAKINSLRETPRDNE